MKYGFCSPGVCLLVPVFGWESFGQREGRRDVSLGSPAWLPQLQSLRLELGRAQSQHLFLTPAEQGQLPLRSHLVR